MLFNFFFKKVGYSKDFPRDQTLMDTVEITKFRKGSQNVEAGSDDRTSHPQ